MNMSRAPQIQRLQATLHETELALRRERDRACMLELEVQRLLRDKPVSRSPSAHDLQPPLADQGDDGTTTWRMHTETSLSCVSFVRSCCVSFMQNGMRHTATRACIVK